eukprot:PhM_4_TR205/c0_g1_i1/m.95642/K18408/TDRD9; ATP-dependent RNA helicase TDRD9
MGIKKLTSHIEHHKGEFKRRLTFPIKGGKKPTTAADAASATTTVLVDGTGFSFLMMEHALTLDEFEHYQDADILRGDTWITDVCLERVIRTFHGLGVRLIFLKDGDLNQEYAETARDATLDKRALEHRDTTQHQYDYCRGEVSNKTFCAWSKVYPAQLARQIAIGIERLAPECGCEVVHTNGEVDMYGAAFCKKYSAACLITGDSDFLAMYNVPVVLTRDLPWVSILTNEVAETGTMTVPLFLAEDIQGHFKLKSREMLWKLAALAGNDITMPRITNHISLTALADNINKKVKFPVLSDPAVKKLVDESNEFYTLGSKQDVERAVTVEELKKKDKDTGVRSAHHVEHHHWPPFTAVQENYPLRDRLREAMRYLRGFKEVTIVEPIDGPRTHLVEWDNGDEDVTLDGLLAYPPRDRYAWLEQVLEITPKGSMLQGPEATNEALWLMNAVFENVRELEVVASVAVIMGLNDYGAYYLTLTNNKTVLGKRPEPREAELAFYVTTAYGHLCDVFDHLELPYRQPADFYSGTLLHCLYADSGFSVNKLRGDVRAAVGKIVTMIKTRGAKFEGLRALTAETGPAVNTWDDADVAKAKYDEFIEKEEMVDLLDSVTGGTGDAPTVGRVRGTTRPGGVAAPQGTIEAATGALPIEPHIPSILESLHTNDVICIRGGTGCGKSSMVPFSIYCEARRQKRRVRIIVTQPRRLAATSLATRVAKMLGEEVGETVGFRIGNLSKDSNRTQILFVTTGYFLQAIAHNTALFGRATHVVLDEVHERSLEADMLTMILKLRSMIELQESNCSKKIVIMSATLQADLFSKYFQELNQESGPVPHLSVGERRCKVDEHYIDDIPSVLPPGTPELVKREIRAYATKLAALRNAESPAPRLKAGLVANLILSAAQHGICVLVFFPGLHDIECCFDELSKAKSICSLRMHVLHSIVSHEEQQAVIAPCGPDECKVILSTNIAETSITIPDVKLVIDLGMARRMAYDRARGMRALSCVWCSRSAAIQRAGRAGRVSDGTVMRLYPRKLFDTMREFDPSELYPLEHSVLQMRALLGHFGDVYSLMEEIVDPPDVVDVREAVENLISWGALADNKDMDVLLLGRLAVSLPVDVRLVRAILMAMPLDLAPETIVIACALSLQRSPFLRPLRVFYNSDHEYMAEIMRSVESTKYFDRERNNDLLSMLAIYEESSSRNLNRFAGDRRIFDFCRDKALNARMVRAFRASVADVSRRVLTFFDGTEAKSLPMPPNTRTRLAVMSDSMRGKSDVPPFGVFSDYQKELKLNLILANVCEATMIGSTTRKKEVGDIVEAAPMEMCVFNTPSKEVKALTLEQLRLAFGAFGPVRDVKVHPKGGTVVVRFTDKRPPAPKNVTRNTVVLPCEMLYRLAVLDRTSQHCNIAIEADKPAIAFPVPKFALETKWDGIVHIDGGIKIDRWSTVTKIGDLMAPPLTKKGDKFRPRLAFAFSLVAMGNSIGASSCFALDGEPVLTLLYILATVRDIGHYLSVKVNPAGRIVGVIVRHTVFENVDLSLTFLNEVNAVRMALASSARGCSMHSLGDQLSTILSSAFAESRKTTTTSQAGSSQTTTTTGAVWLQVPFVQLRLHDNVRAYVFHTCAAVTSFNATFTRLPVRPTVRDTALCDVLDERVNFRDGRNPANGSVFSLRPNQKMLEGLVSMGDGGSSDDNDYGDQDAYCWSSDDGY